MHTLIILICCFGFFMLYNTSKKAKLSTSGSLERWVQRRPGFALKGGLAFIIASIIALIIYDGVAIGSCAALLLLMSVASYMIAIAPFFYLKLKHVLSLTILAFTIEIFIF